MSLSKFFPAFPQTPQPLHRYVNFTATCWELIMADASKFTPKFIESSAAASHTSPDRLSTLPTEVLLMITSNLHPRVHFHLVPKTPACRSKRGKPRYSRVTRFCCHPHVLALSRTCKQLHAVLSPEFFRALMRKEKHDLLEFAMKRGDVRLAHACWKEGMSR